MSSTLTSAPGKAERACAIRDWTPYAAGAGIGILSWIVFAVVDAPIGITTALSQAAGAAAAPVIGAEAVAGNSYWAKTVPAWDYGTLFLAGTLLGAFVSALVSGRFRFEAVPQVWRERFGPSKVRRYAAAFLGGIVIMYGARLAGGCTSGHGISGGLQLAVSSWTFLAVMFATGLGTTAILYANGDKR